MKQRPPLAPRTRLAPAEPSWRAILASYATIVAIPVLLWVTSRPLAGGVALAVAAGLLVGAGRARRLARCVRRCRGIAFDLVGDVRITVTWAPAHDSCHRP